MAWAAELCGCDENLCGSTLTKAERALFTHRRKQAWEALHPEVRHGGNQGEDGRFVPSRKIQELAERANVTVNTVARFESGKPANRSTLTLIKNAFEAAGVEFIENSVIVPQMKSGDRNAR